MKISKLINFLRNRYAPRGAKLSFSQAGEDLIMSYALSILGISNPTYIDIGGHHPVFGNNTYLFYHQNGRGIVVEPIESLCQLIRNKRPEDTCVPAGAGKSDGQASFYNFPQNTRSTFSSVQAVLWSKQSGQKASVSQIPIYSLDTLIERYLNNRCPDLVSIDAEGYDFQILSGFSFKYRPKFFCVETLANTEQDQLPTRNTDIYALFKKNNYHSYAETPANTIFADSKVLLK